MIYMICLRAKPSQRFTDTVRERKRKKERNSCNYAQAQALSTTTSPSPLLNSKYPIASPTTTATNTPPLNDITASIIRYPIVELIPNRTAPPNLAALHRPSFGWRRGASIGDADAGGDPAVAAMSLRRMRRSSKYW